jgi:DNA-binding transcriptional LysR family regulator
MPIDPLKELDFGALITLDALLRHASVTRASEELDTSPSAVSHTLARLRALLGDALFVKLHNRLEPTPRALVLASQVAELLALARETLSSEKGFHPGGAERILRLCLDDLGELAILPQLIAHLRATAPGYTVRTIPQIGHSLEDLIGYGKADLAIMGPQTVGADVVQQRLYDHRFTIIASKACALNGSISAKEYLAYEHVAYSPSLADEGWLRRRLDKTVGPRRVRVSTPHQLLIPHLVQQDAALIAVVPALLATTCARSGQVKVLAPTFPLPKIQVFQYWHRRFQTDPFSVWLREQVKTLFYRNPALHID